MIRRYLRSQYYLLVARLLTRMGWSQRAIARRLNVSPMTIGLWLRGQCRPGYQGVQRRRPQ